MIDSFTGPYNWLSNFCPCILHQGFPTTVEHAYQAAKCTNTHDAAYIFGLATPGQAKRAGRSVPLRPDWEQVKIPIMTQLIEQKFHLISNPILHAQLMNTGDAELIEGNTWGDRFWGMVKNRAGVLEGENHLGKIIMQVRQTWRRAG